jgi:hypothetical protein
LENFEKVFKYDSNSLEKMEETKKNEGEKGKNTVTETEEVDAEVGIVMAGIVTEVTGAESATGGDARNVEADSPGSESKGEGASTGVKRSLADLDGSGDVETLRGTPLKLQYQTGMKTARKTIGGRPQEQLQHFQGARDPRVVSELPVTCCSYL